MSPAAAERSFAEIAAELSLFDAATLAELLAAAAERNSPPEQLALERGLLTAAQADIVRTLQRPRDVIPGYELLAPLGYGGMGVVYRARQIALARPVALKTVLVGSLGDAKALARFEREARTLARLAHPHIVAAIDFGRREGRVFFAMELVEGENVEQLVARRGPLDEYTACGLVRQAAAALAHAAEEGVIHRDIKPSNLLLVPPPAGFPLPAGVPLLKVADFGLALLSEAASAARLTTANIAVGSPHYMSPEQLRGEPLDGRSDMYALGASLYHMLAGTPPLAELSLAQIVAAKLHAGLPPIAALRPDLSPPVLDLVARLTAGDPAGRYRDYAELLAALDGLALLPPAAIATQALPVAPRATPTWALPEASSRPDQAATTTLPLAPPSAPTKPDHPAEPPALDTRRWILLALGAVPIAALGIGAWLLLRPGWPERPLVPVGSVQPLFAGRTLAGWAPLGGQWHPEKMEDGAYVVSGEDGALQQMLRPAEHYRIQLTMASPSAKSAGVVFGATQRATFLHLEISSSSARLRRTFKASEDLGTFPLAPRAAGEFRLVQLERQPGRWWVFIDGQPITTIPDPEPAELQGLILNAEQGKAWFADIEVQSLGQPPSQ